MARRPYTIPSIVDVALSSTVNLIEGLTGRVLDAPSRVVIFANRETVDISYTINIGAEVAMLRGVSAVNTTAGDAPSTQDDLIIDTFGEMGDEIIIDATNADAAAAREARVLVFVSPVTDMALAEGMRKLGLL